MDSRVDHDMKGTRPPASPFEWRRFVVEEDARRNAARVLPTNKTPRKIVKASKTTLDTIPRPFHIYNLSKKASSK
jgi:hypothetical protein